MLAFKHWTDYTLGDNSIWHCDITVPVLVSFFLFLPSKVAPSSTSWNKNNKNKVAKVPAAWQITQESRGQELSSLMAAHHNIMLSICVKLKKKIMKIFQVNVLHTDRTWSVTIIDKPLLPIFPSSLVEGNKWLAVHKYTSAVMKTLL